MSGIEFCKEIEAKKQKLKTDKKTISVIKEFATAGLNRLWEKKEGDDDNEVYNFIKSSYQKNKDTVSVNYCSNFIGGSQTNIYEQNPSCLLEIHKKCYNNITKKYDEICLDKLYAMIDDYSRNRSDQTNINIQFAECNINSILGILSQAEQKLENLAIIKLIEEEQQKNKKSTSDSCSELSSDITKNQYIRSFLACTNKNIINQQNIINSECYSGISSQINVNNSIDKCIIESNVASESRTQITKKPDNINNTTPTQQNTKPPVDNQTNLISIFVIFIGFIMLMVFLFFIFKR